METGQVGRFMQIEDTTRIIPSIRFVVQLEWSPWGLRTILRNSVLEPSAFYNIFICQLPPARRNANGGRNLLLLSLIRNPRFGFPGAVTARP